MARVRTLESESKDIGQYTYYVQQLDAVRGSKALLRLLKYMGPVIEAAFAKGDLGAGAKVTELLSEEDFEYFRQMMAEQTTVTGGDYGENEPQLDKVFATHFAANYFDMFLWLRFALEVNFRSFFATAVTKVVEAMATAKAAKGTDATPSSLPKPTGPSGAS